MEDFLPRITRITQMDLVIRNFMVMRMFVVIFLCGVFGAVASEREWGLLLGGIWLNRIHNSNITARSMV